RYRISILPLEAEALLDLRQEIQVALDATRPSAQSVSWAKGLAGADLRDQLCDQRCELAWLDRLRQVRLEPRSERLPPILRARKRRQRHGRDLRAALPFQRSYPADQAVAVSVRHPDVADQDIGSLALECFERLVGGRSGAHFGSGLLQDDAQELPGIVIVVHHQQPRPSQGRQPRPRRPLAGMWRRGGDGSGFVQRRQLDGERRALTLARTLRPHGATV